MNVVLKCRSPMKSFKNVDPILYRSVQNTTKPEQEIQSGRSW
jgi:hypothetical protein